MKSRDTRAASFPYLWYDDSPPRFVAFSWTRWGSDFASNLEWGKVDSPPFPLFSVLNRIFVLCGKKKILISLLKELILVSLIYVHALSSRTLSVIIVCFKCHHSDFILISLICVVFNQQGNLRRDFVSRSFADWSSQRRRFVWNMFLYFSGSKMT